MGSRSRQKLRRGLSAAALDPALLDRRVLDPLPAHMRSGQGIAVLSSPPLELFPAPMWAQFDGACQRELDDVARPLKVWPPRGALKLRRLALSEDGRDVVCLATRQPRGP